MKENRKVPVRDELTIFSSLKDVNRWIDAVMPCAVNNIGCPLSFWIGGFVGCRSAVLAETESGSFEGNGAANFGYLA